VKRAQITLSGKNAISAWSRKHKAVGRKQGGGALVIQGGGALVMQCGEMRPEKSIRMDGRRSLFLRKEADLDLGLWSPLIVER
jgi:hypothetical protein